MDTASIFDRRGGRGAFSFVIPGMAFSCGDVQVDFTDGEWVLTYRDNERTYTGRAGDQVAAYLDLIKDRAGLKEEGS